jgi:N-acetylmuramate 1-kinase
MNNDRNHAIDAFLKSAGWADGERHALPGDASTRRYVRLRKNGHGALLMDQPQGAETPPAPQGASEETRRALGYNALARLAGPDCARFVAAAAYLRSLGLSAPEIYALDAAQGLVLIEDLGDALYADVLAAGGDAAALYEAAAAVLARLHGAPAPAALAPDKPLFAYDAAALIAEADLITEWFFPVALNRAAREDEIAEHRALWRAALKPYLQSPGVFVHRDYHAQNLIWMPQRRGAARVGLIDFQDAVAGSPAYDLISLTEDARRDVPESLAAAATKAYLDAMAAQGAPRDAAAFSGEMAVFAAQRNAKIAGIFARLHKRDGKTRYLNYLPRVWRYLTRDLEHPALSALKSWYDRNIPPEVRGASAAKEL